MIDWMNLSLSNSATIGPFRCNKPSLPHLFRIDLTRRPFGTPPCSWARLYTGWRGGWRLCRRSIHHLCRVCRSSSADGNISNTRFGPSPISRSWPGGLNSSLESPSYPSGRRPFPLCRRGHRVHRVHRVRLCRRERWRNNLDCLHTCD